MSNQRNTPTQNIDLFDKQFSNKTKAKSRGGKLIQVNSAKADTLNRDGYPAFTQSEAREIFRITQCGLVGNQYYTPKEIQESEAVNVLIKAANKNPKQLLQALKLSRQSNMKFAPKLGIVALSTQVDFVKKYEADIVELLKTYHPGQLLEYVEMQKNYSKGLGSRQQRWVAQVLRSWDNKRLELYTVKYRKQMNYLFRLVHPRFTNSLVNFIFAPQEGTEKGLPVGEMQKAFTKIINAKDCFNIQVAGKLMLEKRVPFDVVKSIGSNDPRWWFAMMMSMGTQALLLNTRSLLKHGVFELDGAVPLYREMLNPEAIKRGRINPLDIVKTYLHVEDAQIRSILAEALGESFDTPIRGIEDDVLEISIDSSASMRNGYMNAEPHSYLLANVLAYNFFGKAKDIRYSWFENNKLHGEGQNGYPKWTGDRKVDMKSVMDYPYRGGYTDPSISIQLAISEHKHVDKFIIVTDEQQNVGTPVDKVFRTYQKKVNPNAVLIVVNVCSYPWSAIPEATDMVVYNAITPTIFNAVGSLGTDVETVLSNVELTGDSNSNA